MNDWPGAARARASRQWPTLEGIVRRAGEIDAIDGVIAIGSVATGVLDELSDVDVLIVVAPGAFEEVWEERHRLAGDPLVTWRPSSRPRPQMEWMNWLTRDLIKVECGVVDPTAGGKELAEPFAVLLGDPSLADRFPHVSIAVIKQRRAEVEERQRDFDRSKLTPGELIDWKLWELKHAVRAARHEPRG